MEKNYYEIYKKYDKLVNKIDNKITNIVTDIVYKKKIVNDLKNFKYSKDDMKKFILSIILTISSIIITTVFIINPIKLASLSFIQNIIFTTFISSVCIFTTLSSSLKLIKYFPSKIDNQVILNIESEISNLDNEKNKLIEELKNINTIKKDIDDLSIFYNELYKQEYEEKSMCFQKKKFR